MSLKCLSFPNTNIVSSWEEILLPVGEKSGFRFRWEILFWRFDTHGTCWPCGALRLTGETLVSRSDPRLYTRLLLSPTRATITVSHRCQSERGFEMISWEKLLDFSSPSIIFPKREMTKSPIRAIITVSHRCQYERGFEMISQDFVVIFVLFWSVKLLIFVNHISKEGNVPHPALLTSKSHKASLREVSRRSGETFLTSQSMACICWFQIFLNTSSPYTHALAN